jgi:hypothetical protein
MTYISKMTAYVRAANSRPCGIVVLMLIILLLLSSCSRLLENDYRRVTPLLEQAHEPIIDGASPPRVSNYSELKAAVLRMVRSGTTEGRVRMRNYTGNARNDAERVCHDILRNEPIGAYALEYIGAVTTQVITDFDVVFSLTFRRTYEQIQAVENIGGPRAFEDRLIRTFSTFDSELTFETSLYSEDQFDFGQIKNRVYYDHPAFAQGMPLMHVSFYPETGLRRIIEITLTYPHDTEQLLWYSARTMAAAAAMVNDLPSNLTYPQKALALYNALGAICTFDHELYSAMAEGHKTFPKTFDAFFNERVLPESYALAFKLLCDIAGIPAHVVIGQRGPDEHAWNLIKLEGHWYHADLAADSKSGEQEHNYFLVLDSFIQEDYRWRTLLYPAAEYGELTYAIVANHDDDWSEE